VKRRWDIKFKNEGRFIRFYDDFIDCINYDYMWNLAGNAI